MICTDAGEVQFIPSFMLSFYTRGVIDLGANCRPSSFHAGVEIPRNSPAITRYFALPWNERDAHLTPKSITPRVYRRTDPEPRQKIWATGFTIGSGLSGVLWGIAGVYFYLPESLEYQLFILFILMGMGAGAISSLTAYMPAFYAFLPVSLLPIGAMLIQTNDTIHTTLGIMTVVYLAGLSFFAQPINKALVESLTLRFENIDLVEKLSQQRDEAERANISKSKFLAAASHDLRQPLHALTLFTAALDERIKYPETRKIVDNINNSVQALENLFNTLLDVSRLDAGVLQPTRRHFPLQDLCQRLINDYTPETEANGLTLEYSPCDIVVNSDLALLERILRNFISNAIRYTEKGRVKIICVPCGENIRIDVLDTGIGIPPEQQRDIFKEFHQLDNPERDRKKGLGLGLAIVDRLSQLLAHPIELQSTPGKGSRFSVSVPRGDPRLVFTDTIPSVGETSHNLAGLRVMVVDDEISVREGMFTLLDGWGCEVILAGSEDEAVADASSEPPDAIIMDYRLRDGRNGPQAIARLINEFGHTIPALIVTGDTATERLREAKASGYQLIHKPIQPAMLRAFLHNVCNDKH
jgi:signal transduction histidine kinase